MEMVMTGLFSLLATISFILVWMARNPKKKFFIGLFGVANIVFAMGPNMLRVLITLYPVSSLITGLFFIYTIGLFIFRIINGENKEGAWINLCTGLFMIVVLVFGGQQFLTSFYHTTVEKKVEAASSTASDWTKTTKKVFQKITKPFWSIEESDFTVYVDRKLLSEFNNGTISVIEFRLRDLARSLGSDPKDARLENLYIGGFITNDRDEYYLISLTNAGRIEIDCGMVLPSRGGRYSTVAGIGFINPSNVTLKISDDDLIISSELFNITVTRNGEVIFVQTPHWNGV